MDGLAHHAHDPGRLDVDRLGQDFPEDQLHLLDEAVVPERVYVGHLEGEARLPERRVHHVLEVVGPGVLEEQDLLGDEERVAGDRIELRPILVERLVDLLHDVRNGDRAADEEVVSPLDAVDPVAQLVEPCEKDRVLHAVYTAGVDDELEGDRAPELLVDDLGGLPQGLVGWKPAHDVVRELQPCQARERDDDDHDGGSDHRAGVPRRVGTHPNDGALQPDGGDRLRLRRTTPQGHDPEQRRQQDEAVDLGEDDPERCEYPEILERSEARDAKGEQPGGGRCARHHDGQPRVRHRVTDRLFDRLAVVVVAVEDLEHVDGRADPDGQEERGQDLGGGRQWRVGQRHRSHRRGYGENDGQ